MYSRILITTDGSELSGKGLQQGIALAKALGSEVTIVNVSEPWTPIGVDATGASITEYGLIDEFEKAEETEGKKILEAAAQTAVEAGIVASTIYIPRKYPADAIIDYVAENDIELVVMASHGRRGIGRLLLGSQTAEVATRSTVPVLVIR
ncbi:MAG: universal stress protein [Devosia sp.]